MRDLAVGDMRLDEQLEGLAAGIVERVGFDPPEVGVALRPPQLRVARGQDQGLKSYTVIARGVPTILLGGALYTVIRQYCRAAATFFLPSKQGGPRPSEFWGHARAALATGLDWYTSPATEPRMPQFEVTPWQEHVADAFAAYTYRFVLCHEMAHVALGHVDTDSLESTTGSRDDVTVLRASQEHELDADRFGLELQLHSLPDRTQVVTALSAAVYFVYFNTLFDDSRLMLLSELVDYRAWKIEYTHPPFLGRVFNLMGAAQGLEGEVAAKGVEKVHGSLSHLIGELREAADKNQEHVAAKAGRLLARESRRRQPDTSALLALFERSPLGVLRALDSAKGVAGSDPARHKATSRLIDQLLAQLPAEFGEFHSHTPAERSKQLA